MNQIKKEIATLLLLAICSIGTSVLLFECKKSPETANGDTGYGGHGSNEIWIQNMAFYPTTITVGVNTTLTWVNKDATAHTVSSTSSEFESGSLTEGANYSYQFRNKGTFPYKCSIHSTMTGTVVVK